MSKTLDFLPRRTEDIMPALKEKRICIRSHRKLTARKERVKEFNLNKIIGLGGRKKTEGSQKLYDKLQWGGGTLHI